MSQESSVIAATATPLPHRSGLAWGFLGVLAFSFTVPLTRVATQDLDPLVVGAGRAVIAAGLAAAALVLTRQRRPAGRQWVRLAVVAGGVVIGFPLLTSYALTSADASHGAVVIGLLPAATAVLAVLRGRERSPVVFWVFSALGAGAAVVFALVQGGGAGGVGWADLLLFGAVLAAAVGYAEGGLLSRELGAWQTVCWALVLSAPVMVALTLVSVAGTRPSAGPAGWLAFAYLSLVSMFLGFFAWYQGLSIGPMGTVSQVQLVQPLLSLLWAALLLGEVITWPTVLAGLAVIACAGAAVRVRFSRSAPS